MRSIACITEPPAIKSVLTRLGEPIAPPIVACARAPPLWELAIAPIASVPDWADTPPPVPAFDVDPRLHG